MADVWDFGPEDATECQILGCLANHCDDDGRSCFPSIARIARMSRRSERTVIRVVAALEEGGWIEVERGAGRGQMSQYAINVAKLKGCHGVTLSGFPEKVTLTTEKGDIDDKKGDIDDKPPHPLNGRTVKEPSGNRAAPARASAKSAGGGGEFMAATWLLEELGLAAGPYDVRMVAQVISYATWKAPRRHCCRRRARPCSVAKR